jgi:hypothetical protein
LKRFQTTKLDGVMVSQSRGVSGGKVRAILLLLHVHKRITLLITLPLTEMTGTGIVRTTQQPSARIDTT